MLFELPTVSCSCHHLVPGRCRDAVWTPNGEHSSVILSSAHTPHIHSGHARMRNHVCVGFTSRVILSSEPHTSIQVNAARPMFAYMVSIALVRPIGNQVWEVWNGFKRVRNGVVVMVSIVVTLLSHPHPQVTASWALLFCVLGFLCRLHCIFVREPPHLRLKAFALNLLVQVCVAVHRRSVGCGMRPSGVE